MSKYINKQAKQTVGTNNMVCNKQLTPMRPSISATSPEPLQDFPKLWYVRPAKAQTREPLLVP